jgi:hypothetical protein
MQVCPLIILEANSIVFWMKPVDLAQSQIHHHLVRSIVERIEIFNCAFKGPSSLNMGSPNFKEFAQIVIIIP